MHLTWSNERVSGFCNCGEKTVLISFSGPSVDDEEPRLAELGGWIDISEELTGHFCPKCDAMTSLSLNSQSQRPQ